MKFENGLPADASSQEKLLRWAFDLNCALIEARAYIGDLGVACLVEYFEAYSKTELYGNGHHGLAYSEVDSALRDTYVAAGIDVCERYANGYGRHAIIRDGTL
jgi:hypothetical protein